MSIPSDASKANCDSTGDDPKLALTVDLANLIDSYNTLLAELRTRNLDAPTGTVASFAGSSAPSGWLLCYGQAVSRTTYAALFAVISTTYGTGDGSTTFNVPDMRGLVAVGKDDMGGTAASRITSGTAGFSGTTLGAIGGDQRLHSHTHTGSGTTSSDGAHTHTLPQTFTDGGSNSYGAGSTTPFGSPPSTDSGGAHTHTYSFTTASSGSGGAQNVQPSMILNSIIKT